MKPITVVFILCTVLLSSAEQAAADFAQIRQLDAQLSRASFGVVSPSPACYSWFDCTGTSGQLFWEDVDDCDASTSLRIEDSGVQLACSWPELVLGEPGWQLVNVEGELRVLVYFAEPARLSARHTLTGTVDFDDLLVTLTPLVLDSGSAVELLRSGESDESETLVHQPGLYWLDLSLRSGQTRRHALYSLELAIDWEPVQGLARQSFTWGQVKARFE